MNCNKVLLIDDQPDTVRMLGLQFKKKFNCNVIEAHSVDEAEKVLSSENIQVVVSDFEMPHKSGADLASFLQHENIAVALLFFTGLDRPSRFWESLDYPCVAVMKPDYGSVLEIAKAFLNDR